MSEPAAPPLSLEQEMRTKELIRELLPKIIRTMLRAQADDRRQKEGELSHAAYLKSYPYRLGRLPFSTPTELGWHGLLLTLINIVLTIVIWRSLRRAMADQAMQRALHERTAIESGTIRAINALIQSGPLASPQTT